MELSVVSSCYGVPTLLREFVKQLTEMVFQLIDSYEFIMVEDCSPYNSRSIIDEVNPRPTYLISEIKNFEV